MRRSTKHFTDAIKMIAIPSPRSSQLVFAFSKDIKANFEVKYNKKDIEALERQERGNNKILEAWLRD
jgi:hypothetical protein